MIARLIFTLIGLWISILGTDFFQKLTFNNVNDREVLAWVNQKPITVAQAEIGSIHLFGQSYSDMSDRERNSLVQVLIDEELLIQRGELLKIPRRDIGVRKSLVSASIRDIIGEFEAIPVSEETLRDFFHEHSSIFETPKRIALDVIVLTKKASAQHAQSLIARGLGLSEVAETLRLDFVIPQDLQTVPIIHRQLGAKIASTAVKLQEGEISPPVRGSEGIYYMQITAFEDTILPSFDDVRQSVKQEYKRRGRNLALRKTLDALANEADIDVDITLASHK